MWPSVIANTETSIPSKYSSIRTFLLASPNFSSRIIFDNSLFASSRSSSIRTPFPAARPSALSTYGGLIFSRKEIPSDKLFLLKVLDFAHGILFLNINSLEKSLLPSSLDPSELGPNIFTCFSLSSDLKKSTIPLTKGSSGPTITKSIDFSITFNLTSLKSLILTDKFFPTDPVPAFPGAMYKLLHFSL